MCCWPSPFRNFPPNQLSLVPETLPSRQQQSLAERIKGTAMRWGCMREGAEHSPARAGAAGVLVPGRGAHRGEWRPRLPRD